MKRRRFLKMLGLGASVPLVEPVLARIKLPVKEKITTLENTLPNGDKPYYKYEPTTKLPEISWRPIGENVFAEDYMDWELNRIGLHGHTRTEIRFTLEGLSEHFIVGEDRIVKINNETYNIRIINVVLSAFSGNLSTTEVHGIAT